MAKSTLTEADIRAALAREVTKMTRQEKTLAATKATVQLWQQQLAEIGKPT